MTRGLETKGRRSFITGLVASGAIFGATEVCADITCAPYDPNGVQMCDVGLIVGSNTALQEKELWCWAACIQAVFRFHGRSISQESIVEKVFGDAINSSADGPRIIAAVNGAWKEEKGSSFMAAGSVLMDANYGINSPYAIAIAAQQLAQNNPLIVGSNGHAMVLTGMRYFRDVYGRGIPGNFVVRDPWPTARNRRMLTQDEVMGATFLAAIQVG